ncbi:D-hexose-6-phosphate mutarotase [Gordonia sp. PKS22-38]|uniref:Putative glucose-6-phosphate 1-epimerase n=1 Tax=Gordonia prachuapensis TaxID=3115651 RepID=A0ABU7MY78_9ACTN|nr:D-hexose-6-phosphate mutarotase [Gordonia sp. PKS22-38]
MTESDDIGGVRHGVVHGFEAIVVETPAATAAVSLFAGQILSFVPAGHEEVLWVSPLVAAPPTPIRGGIPVCWPYFAREGQSDDVPSHGYARTARWALTGSRASENGDTQLELVPEGLDHLDLTVHMTVQVGATLTQGLHTHNPTPDPITMTEAFHNYFRVSDVDEVQVDGLDGLDYIDKFDDMATRTQRGNWSLPKDSGRSDRIYPDAGGTYRIVDPGLRRNVEVTSRGGRSAVVWNPGEAAASGMADVGSHWRDFVCVEAANAGPNRVEVPAGSDHSLWQTISVAPLG